MMGKLPEITAMDRLRWIVCKRFGVLPGSAALTDADYLRCGVNMLIDRQGSGSGTEANPSFDSGRFDELKAGGQ